MQARVRFSLLAVTLGGTVASLAYARPAVAQEYSTMEVRPSRESTYHRESHRSDWRAPRNSVQFGARTGYGLGSGVVYSGFPVSEGTSGYVPFILDVGYRILPQLYVGAYGQFGIVTNKNNAISCPDGFDCATQNWRFGVQADYHFLHWSRFDPYIGLNFGYEVLHSSVSGTTPVAIPGAGGGASTLARVDGNATDRGWEFVGLTLGSDYRINRNAAIGLFASASLNAYNVHTGSRTIRIGDRVDTTRLGAVTHGAHQIYILGVRATFDVPVGEGGYSAYRASVPNESARTSPHRLGGR